MPCIHLVSTFIVFSECLLSLRLCIRPCEESAKQDQRRLYSGGVVKMLISKREDQYLKYLYDKPKATCMVGRRVRAGIQICLAPALQFITFLYFYLLKSINLMLKKQEFKAQPFCWFTWQSSLSLKFSESESFKQLTSKPKCVVSVELSGGCPLQSPQHI